nr:unnamed protein product [Haemonchus contortus]
MATHFLVNEPQHRPTSVGCDAQSPHMGSQELDETSRHGYTDHPRGNDKLESFGGPSFVGKCCRGTSRREIGRRVSEKIARTEKSPALAFILFATGLSTYHFGISPSDEKSTST